MPKFVNLKFKMDLGFRKNWNELCWEPQAHDSACVHVCAQLCMRVGVCVGVTMRLVTARMVTDIASRQAGNTTTAICHGRHSSPQLSLPCRRWHATASDSSSARQLIVAQQRRTRRLRRPFRDAGSLYSSYHVHRSLVDTLATVSCHRGHGPVSRYRWPSSVQRTWPACVISR